MFRSPRLEALFGKRLDQVTYDDITALVGNPVAAEAADLDYKKLVHAKDDKGKVEFCKDVVAMGNGEGGILVIGVEEDAQAVPSAVPGVDISDNEQRRLMSLLIQTSPHLPVKPQPLQEPGKPGHGVLMFLVERSALAPHAILDTRKETHHKDGWLRYPIRNGASTRWMQEPEVATRYRRRFLEARVLGERLNGIEDEALTSYTSRCKELASTQAPRSEAMFPASVQREIDQRRPACPVLSIALAPELPGRLRIDHQVYTEFQRQALAERTVVGSGSVFDQAKVGPGRLIGLAGGTSAITRYAELHTDGSGVLIINFAPPSARIQDKPFVGVPMSLLLVWLLSGLRLLGRHARDRASASGVASIRARLLNDSGSMHWNDTRHVVNLRDLQLTDANGWEFGQPAEDSEGSADSLVDDVADDGPALVAAASLLGDALFNGFGIAEAPGLTASGGIVLGAWGRFQADINSWAQASGIDCQG